VSVSTHGISMLLLSATVAAQCHRVCLTHVHISRTVMCLILASGNSVVQRCPVWYLPFKIQIVSLSVCQSTSPSFMIVVCSLAFGSTIQLHELPLTARFFIASCTFSPTLTVSASGPSTVPSGLAFTPGWREPLSLGFLSFFFFSGCPLG